jgi:hypothetical protein
MATPSVRLARFTFFGLVLAFAAAVAVPAARTVRALARGDCEPDSWMDWHLAMRRQCLAPEYVCTHMTTPGMLGDPEIAEGYRRGLARGVDAYGALAEMVGQMRDEYGCEPEARAASRLPGAGRRSPLPGHGPQPDPDAAHRSLHLPPGHPPISFDAPPSVTL